MRPRYEISRIRSIDLAEVAVLRPEEMLADMTPDRSPWLLGDFGWGDVDHWLAVETEALDAIDARAESPEEFERLANEAPYEADEAWPPVELGAISIVAALNAARCPTAWSTRGSSSQAPSVYFFSDADRARIVLAVAKRLDLGLTLTQDRCLDLVAGSVDELLTAARELAERSDALDRIAPPPTAALLGPDGYWAQDLDALREALELE